MKYIFSYSLIFIFLLQSVGNTFFFLDYQISIEKYEAKCENLQKPELNCHGKCQMIKQSKQFGFWEKDTSKQPKSPSLKSIKSLDNFVQDNRRNEFVFSVISVENNFTYIQNYSFKKGSIFHPPPELV